MCEYCGCQAVEAIDELTREHDLVVEMISLARADIASGDVARMAQTARRISEVLRPHTDVEEHGLFPAMAEEFPAHVASLEAEHLRIEAVLAEAAGADPADPSWPERLSAVLDTLRAHILKEQDGVFPATLASLNSADWARIEAVRARVGSMLPSRQGA